MNIKLKNQKIEKIGVFFVFLLVSLFAVFVYSPVGSSYADVAGGEDVGPYTMSMSNSSSVAINATPISTQRVYATATNVEVKNTCPAGATITMAVNSNSFDSLLRKDSANDYKKSIAMTTKKGVLDDNSWGISVNGGSTYQPVPLKSVSSLAIYNATAAQTTSKKIPVVFGVKIDNQTPSGAYENDIIYTMIPKSGCLGYDVAWDLASGTKKSGASYPTFVSWGEKIDISKITPTRDGYAFMGWKNGSTTYYGKEGETDLNPSSSAAITMKAQWELPTNMQSFSCSSLSSGKRAAVKDSRDGNIYIVAKLSDGKCWMTQNLRIAGKKITSSDSNLADGASFTIPSSSLSGFSGTNNNAAYVDSYGGYYSFYTATAGWGNSDIFNESAPVDICPKNWRMPTTKDAYNADFVALKSYYGNVSALEAVLPWFDKSGYVSSSSRYDSGKYFDYWSATADNTDTKRAYELTSTGTSVLPSYSHSKGDGLAVRCIADNRTINDIKYMQDITPAVIRKMGTGATATLKDKRDNVPYEIFRAKDGNVWMRRNLRVGGVTLNSSDSNLPAGKTWSIPVNDPSWKAGYPTGAFKTHDTNNAYAYTETSGSYYTFYTVTAGWGDTSKTSGNSPQDICPKRWRGPTSDDYTNHAKYYSTASSLSKDAFYVMNGYAHNGGVRQYEVLANYWTVTAASSTNAYNLHSNGAEMFSPGTNVKYFGFGLRCLVK